ncbi:MAG: response regulator [Reichenbachiella sp.]|uniref:response regulator n=1 Tax=Reichenbachiella sp. TaxID=2184521 RepID=UPI0032659D9E
MKKLDCILLVDDDDDCNYFHKKLLKEMECANHVEVATDGQEALDFLLSIKNNKHPQPQIIFLDINMPVMDGWEFLEEYEKLKPNQKAQVVLVMLTTSLNPDDHERAKKFSVLSDFHNKLLTESKVMDLFKKHFPEHL